MGEEVNMRANFVFDVHLVYPADIGYWRHIVYLEGNPGNDMADLLAKLGKS
jgi:hypothetical protein